MSSSPVFRSPLYEMEASLSVSVPVRARLCQYSHVQALCDAHLSRRPGVEEGLFTMVASRSEEDVARLILDDLLCESPTYAYALTEAGRYREHLHLLLGVRTGSGGLIAAQRTCESLKARDPLFAALSMEPVPKGNRVPEECDIPSLKEEARQPTGCMKKL